MKKMTRLGIFAVVAIVSVVALSAVVFAGPARPQAKKCPAALTTVVSGVLRERQAGADAVFNSDLQTAEFTKLWQYVLGGCHSRVIFSDRADGRQTALYECQKAVAGNNLFKCFPGAQEVLRVPDGNGRFVGVPYIEMSYAPDSIYVKFKADNADGPVYFYPSEFEPTGAGVSIVVAR